MLLIPCPYCGPRPEIEFRCCGEAHITRPSVPSQMSDEALEQLLYIRSNPKGTHHERWRHIHGCARFFNVLRNTISDRIEASYKVGEPRPAAPSDHSA
ncbi:MAG: sarcosine oxidase subunit delta [Gammaproteobacteria bacterium]